jgi:hypothetical protein
MGVLGSGIIAGCAADIVEPTHFLRQANNVQQIPMGVAA